MSVGNVHITQTTKVPLLLMINFLLASIRIKEKAFNYADNFGFQPQMRM